MEVWEAAYVAGIIGGEGKLRQDGRLEYLH